MTLYHFVNCCALAYLPYFITYKHSGISEYGVFWKCIQTGFIYVLCQLVKMLTLATFFPSSPGGDLLGDALKVSLDFADVAAIYAVLPWVAGRGETKVLAVGIGWATAELILSRLLPFWTGARGTEFHPKYLQMALESNASLVGTLSLVSLVYLWSRPDVCFGGSEQRTLSALFPLICALLALSVYKPLLVDQAAKAFAIGAWGRLALFAVSTLCLALVALKLFILAVY